MSDQINVPAGYWASEVGVIPEEWKVKILDDLIDRLESGVSVNSVEGENLSYLNDKCILKTSAVFAGCFKPSESKKIAARDIKRARLSPRRDTILISRMNTPQLVGECGYVGADFPNLYVPDRLWMTRFYPKAQVCPQWLSLLLSTQKYREKIKDSATGTSDSMKNISKDSLLSLEIPFPLLPEQEAIASALRDVDDLLDAQNALVAKKRDLKTAALDELLTPKRRLPGFLGEWEEKTLGEVLKVRHGKSQVQVAEQNGPFPILASGGEIGRANTFLYDKPSVLIGRKGTIDRPQYMETPFWTVDTLFFTEVFPSSDAKFLFYLFQTVPWRDFNEASGVPSLNASTIEAIQFKAPLLAEQKAIAEVLSDMDAEIASLEAERDKTRQLKSAMMDELLSGRTRLL